MLTFEEEGTLQLEPGEVHRVWVIGHPPAPYKVSFSLLGDAGGAWLDRTTATADDEGRAWVELHASNLSTFRLRAATKEGLAAELGVAVSAEGFGTLRVTPVYQGTRFANGWTASVVAGATCEELAATAPEAPMGALVAHGGPGGPVVVTGAPVGPSLAVALHSGRTLWGCARERELQAGITRDVRVPIKDLPVDLAATRLDMTLTIASAEGLDALLEASTERMIHGFLPDGEEAASLLDAMELAAPPEEADAFMARRAALGWDTTAREHLAALSPRLQDRCRGWARAGLAEAPLSIVGSLSGAVDMPGRALFNVSRFGSLPAASAGVPSDQTMSWTADPGDVLRLAGTLSWSPSRYVGGAAGLGAAAEMPATRSIAAALAAAAECPALGAALGGYPGCNSTCMATLCARGLELRRLASMEAPDRAGPTGKLVVNASGHAQIDSTGAPMKWTADWLGTVRDGTDAEASVHGEASAVSTEVPAD
ncbi:hypothetical protein WMF31_23230 [Sorangium sp. So ce1036]|uniref:hypothetical protein n=1 Tax=Sorangium sp. So ce1036 TaxID=3133328 RepID=UPI003EFCBAD0